MLVKITVHHRGCKSKTIYRKLRNVKKYEGYDRLISNEAEILSDGRTLTVYLVGERWVEDLYYNECLTDKSRRLFAQGERKPYKHQCTSCQKSFLNSNLNWTYRDSPICDNCMAENYRRRNYGGGPRKG